MAKSEAVVVDAGGRELRVSSPDRVIFPATERTARGHQARHRQVLPGGRATASCARSGAGRRRSSAGRKGVHPGIVLSTREKGGGDAFFQKRVPQGRAGLRGDGADRVPVGPPRGRDLPDRDRGRRLVRADGHDHVPPVAGARRRRRPSRRAAARPRPAAGHGLRRRRAGRRRGARAARRARLRRLPEDVGRARRPHLRADRAALDVHRRPPRRDRLRPRARAAPAGRGDDEVVEGGARRAHLRRLQPERARPHDRLRLQHPPEAGRAGVGAARPGTSSPRSRPRTSRWRPCRRASPRWATATPRSTTSRTRCSRCWTCTSATRPRAGRHAVPARLPEDAGRAEARAAVARPRPARAEATGACGSFFAPRLVTGRGRRRHDRADVAVGRLVEVDDHRRVVARPLALARLAVDPGGLDALGDRRRSRARGRSACRGPGGTCRRGSPSR